MARAKAMARQSKSPPIPRISPNDPFPDAFISYIEKLSFHYPDLHEIVERPKKRAKTEPGRSQSVLVARDSLTIHRPCLDTDDQMSIISRHHAGHNLTFYLRSNGAPSSHREEFMLNIASQPRSPLGPFAVQIPLTGIPLSRGLVTILRVAEQNSFDPADPGRPWVNVDLEVRQERNQIALELAFELQWSDSHSVLKNTSASPQWALRTEVLSTFFPDVGLEAQSPGRHPNPQTWTPQEFYEAAHFTKGDDPVANSIHIPRLTSTLYPFQKRAIRWLLQREGVCWSHLGHGDGSMGIHKLEKPPSSLPLSFAETTDADGHVCYVSDLLSVVTRDLSPFEIFESQLRGGILSEEMGLGKTVEILGLIMLHRRQEGETQIFDAYLGDRVRSTGATLIVTPNALKNQWLSELKRHAPHLRVMFYEGIKGSRSEEAEEALVEELARQDVVITTYNVLTSELHFTLKPPERSMRNERRYYRPKSPLVQLSWWRVCLDEAQMIENGVSNAAIVARVLPRVNAWVITGTPVKDGVKDLLGLLMFLRHEPYASNSHVWQALTSRHKESFHKLFNRLSLRHTKRMVRDEIAIPPQKRYVMTMPFTAVEEQHYQSLFEGLVKECGLGVDGSPLAENWDPQNPEVLSAMRTALDRLRQTALHPEIGIRNRRALGHRNGPMRTVEEVLNAMMEQSEIAIRADQRNLLMTTLTRGQLLENSPRVKESLAIWQAVLRQTDTLVAECREQLDSEVAQVKTKIAKDGVTEGPREPWRDGLGEEELDEDGEMTVAGKVGDCRRRLRSALEVQHRAVFFCANAYFQIKTNKDMTVSGSEEFTRLEKLETEHYDRAKRIRKEILQECHAKATRIMDKIALDASRQAFVVIPDFKYIDCKGIESRSIIENLDRICASLDGQANQIDDWREMVIQLLLKPLVDEEGEGEITGEEYEDSTKLQDELLVMVQALRTVIADRHDALSGQTNVLVKHESHVAVQQAKNGEGHAPETLLELFAIRDKLKPNEALGSLRGIVSQLRALLNKLRHEVANNSRRAELELEIVRKQLNMTQKQLAQQVKATQAMEQEVERFTAAMNARLEYYRQLQAVSDSVSPYEDDAGEGAFTALVAEEDGLKRKLAASQAKHRYLLHLKEADDSDEQRQCVICREAIKIGVLTICGHQFCKECIMSWFRAHHTCPVCKRRLQASNLHDITLKPQELKVVAESPARGSSWHGHSAESRSKSAIYSEFSSDKAGEIKNIDLSGPNYTTKVDNLVRHLLWLRESDPGAKSIIFTQYTEFLKVLTLAFQRYRIGFTSFDRPGGISQFKEDPAVECFLLHARAHSSGLNLVNASHVFLCEPLVNTALELQAIARVDRIGQENETTVWLYLVDGTVEESIYDVSVRRRMEHMGRETNDKSKESTGELMDATLEAANSLELEQASLSKLMSKDRRSGEAVPDNDLWACLFGNASRNRSDGDGGVLNDPSVISYLAAEAAEGRRQGRAVR